MRVQVDGGHEAGLRGVRVDPAQLEEAALVLRLKDLLLVDGGARVGGSLLLGHHQRADGEDALL